MPTAQAFSAVPPFPDNVPVYELPRLTLSNLVSNDAEQSKELFQSFREHWVRPSGYARLRGRRVLIGGSREDV
jgi:hypothetical protein